MNLTRRKIGAIALIVAGVGAFLVPFLLHSTSPSPASSNNNNGGHTTTTTTTKTPTSPGTTTTTTTGSGDSTGSDSGGGTTTSSSCNETKSHDSDDASDPGSTTSHPDKDNQADSHTGDSPEGHAYGYWKNQLDTTISIVKSMGTHNPAFQSHHSTDTDNDTVHGHVNHADSERSTGTDPSCTDTDSEQDD